MASQRELEAMEEGRREETVRGEVQGMFQRMSRDTANQILERINTGEFRPMLNLDSRAFRDASTPVKGALTSIFLGLATPVLKSSFESIRTAGYGFLRLLGGAGTEDQQQQALMDVVEYSETGVPPSEGIETLVRTDHRLFNMLVSEIKKSPGVAGLGSMTTAFGRDPMSILAPGSAIRGFADSELRDHERLRQESAPFNTRTTRDADTDANAEDQNVRQQQEVFEKATQTNNRAQRDRMIEIINAANNYNENLEIEQMADEFLSDLQEQRIKVNQRPVPSYSQAVNRVKGLFIPVTTSPLVL